MTSSQMGWGLGAHLQLRPIVVEHRVAEAVGLELLQTLEVVRRRAPLCLCGAEKLHC